MSYLVLQIVLWLVAAALLALGFGWFMGRRGIDEALKEEENAKEKIVADWQSRHQEALTLCEVARERIATLESAVDELRSEVLAKSERALVLASQVERAQAKIDALERALSDPDFAPSDSAPRAYGEEI